MTTLNQILEAPDGSIPSLDIKDLLDMLPIGERNTVLQNLLKKIKYDGYIELTGLDLDDVIRASYIGYIDNNILVELLYKDRQSALSCDIMCEMLKSINFKIINTRTNHYIYYIKAQRYLNV